MFQVGKKVGLTDAQIASLVKASGSEAVSNKLKLVTQEALDLGV